MMNLWAGLTIWIVFQAVHTTMAQATGDHKPQVKINMVVEKQTSAPINVNPHLLQESPGKDPGLHKKTSPTEFLEDQSISSVIFNEIESLVLTKSSFRIISYISFKPHLTTFLHISKLLQQTLEKTESFLHAKSFPPYQRTLTGEPKFIQNLKDESIRIQLNELTYEINLVKKNFDSIKTRFSQITGHELDLNDTGKIDTLIGSQPKQNKSRFKRVKRSVISSVFKFLFGGDDDSETIKMLKQNIATLMANDQLQESRLKEILKSQQLNSADIKINRNLIRQMTKDLAQVNVTLTEITQHTEILFTLASFQVSISQLRHRINIIRDALFGLQINLDILYHHFSAMVNNKLSPEMIPPAQLLTILMEVKEDIRDHPKLSLPEEISRDSVYKYYKIMKLEVTMERELMLGVLQIPLVETNKRFRLYKLYNLPLPLPGTNLQVQYELDYQYLAITEGDQYVAFPSPQEIMGCQITAGAFCELNTALFPTLNLAICEFSLYKKEHDQVLQNCRVSTSPFVRDTAISLEPNFWVVITQKPVILHVNCLRDTTYLQPKFPIDILHLNDGCEATAATLVLPGHSRLVKENQFLMTSHSIQLTLQYKELHDFQLIKHIIPRKLSPKQLEAIGKEIPEPQTMTLKKLQGQLKRVNENYPYQMPLVLKIVISIISTMLGLLGIVIIYKCYKNGCSVKRFVPFLCKKTSRKSNKQTTSSNQYIAEYPRRWTRRRPLRSSVTIQEVEMQPMVSPRALSTQIRTDTPPAIEAPKDTQKPQTSWKDPVVPATPDSVAEALQNTTGINFERYYKKKRQRAAAVKTYHL